MSKVEDLYTEITEENIQNISKTVDELRRHWLRYPKEAKTTILKQFLIVQNEKDGDLAMVPYEYLGLIKAKNNIKIVYSSCLDSPIADYIYGSTTFVEMTREIQKDIDEFLK